MKDLKLSEIKEICTKHQKQNRDCETCDIFKFCNYEMTTSYPSGWKIEEKERVTCSSYHEVEYIIGWNGSNPARKVIKHECWGTRECDECNCGGDKSKCDFYPEKRKK